MRILYGVQGTGNGHITRARVMSAALAKAGIEVDYLFSGRPADAYFNMEPFGDYRTRRGMTFVTEAGQVKRYRTLMENSLPELIRDVRALDLSGYDLVLTDFEPVTAWAAKRQKVRSIGVAHQYAFCYRVPGVERAPLLKSCVNLFAPADVKVGVHWHAFNAPILPPLIEPQRLPLSRDAGKILVYLPFEAMDAIKAVLAPFGDYRFVIYARVDTPVDEGNLSIRPLSRDGFQADLASCDGVICNAGFGLCSETLQAGKKLLVKPLKGQVEQFANGRALQKMERGQVMNKLSGDAIAQWLPGDNPDPLPWPDTAGALVDWLAQGAEAPVAELSKRLWSDFHPDSLAEQFS
ncbi:MJ1255/VC2487 family glycosyltransferase [Marinobacterium mangrovicola]|uniref:Uncharacterized protein (TIGR00661 family) n=1 Tax=Marinobacterium mangrovicola TaxID=1476959 RepID=A0A4R1GHH4_9GAMM|nr:MJ1255/VC2487 family glycosyltransferase [Marinobacterium mangrovicola]TCK06175.1 uncharacterized protein (TIGR00661 family) [Marinobacterium mangrovicola]